MFPEQNEFIIQMYRNLYQVLFSYAVKHLKSEELAKEVVQDVFVEAIEKCDMIMNHPKPEGWMMRTLQYKMANLSRMNAKIQRQILSSNGEMIVEILSTDVPEDQVVECEGVQEAQDKIERALSSQEKYLLRRFVFENASHAEVAEELGITVWTCQKRLERIRDKLDKEFPGHRKKKR